MSDPKPPDGDGELTLTALLYAGGELGGAERDAFEQRLAGDQAARDALADAVRTTLALGGTDVLRPDPAYRAGVRRRLRQLLDQLPPPQREVIRQRVYEGKKFREIAEDLGCPLNTALARMHQGLERLRLLWGDHHV